MTDIAEVAKEAARRASNYLKENFNKSKIAFKSSSFDLVTNCDIESQKIIISTIKESFPEHDFLGEEDINRGAIDSSNLWIIDPIDGTNNFAHGIPHFSISIAYCEYGKVKVGIVIDPFREEVFWSIEGEGAWLNDKPISVSSAEDLTSSIIATGFYYDRGSMMKRTLDSIKRLFEAQIQGLRRNGSAALDIAWVACGRFDGFFEYQLSVWDFAAGLLIAKEAGGVITDSSGKDLGLNNKSIAVSNPKIYKDFLEVVG